MDKIKTFFNKNFKSILFCIVFIVVCFFYNLNNQALNASLKRGVILEYSLSENSQINQKELETKLTKEGLKYSFIKNFKTDEYKIFDTDNKLVKNILHVALQIKADIFLDSRTD